MTLGPVGIVTQALKTKTAANITRKRIPFICQVLLYGFGGVGCGTTFIHPSGQVFTYG
jgi:hypothetical protein